MTFLQFVLSYAPAWHHGGPPRIMYDYARYIAAAGHRVIVLAPDSSAPMDRSVWQGFPLGIEVLYYRQYGGWLKRYYFDYSCSQIWKAIARLRNAIDIIHLAQTRCLPNIVALEACRRFGIPIALSSFGSLPRRESKPKWAYDKLFVNPLVRKACLLLGQTHHECEVYAQYGGRRNSIQLLPLAVDLSEGLRRFPDKSRESFCGRFQIPLDSHLFLFLGRLHPTKGLDFLVKAFARVLPKEPRSFLALVGHDEGVAGEIRRLAETLGISHRLRMCGPLYDQDRWQAYSSADTFVITPRVFEETSLASIEALSCGTPVLTNVRADIPHLEEYGAGFVIEADEESAVNRMLTLVREDEKARAIRRTSALSLAREVFDIKVVAARLLHLADQAIGS